MVIGQKLIFTIIVASLVVGSMVSLRVIRDTERLAVTVFGCFVKLRGPGLLFIWPGRGYEHYRLRVGATGEVVADDHVVVDGFSVPYVSDESFHLGQWAQVVGFSGNAVKVVPSSEVFVCENCGHTNKIQRLQ